MLLFVPLFDAILLIAAGRLFHLTVLVLIGALITLGVAALLAYATTYHRRDHQPLIVTAG